MHGLTCKPTHKHAAHMTSVIPSLYENAQTLQPRSQRKSFISNESWGFCVTCYSCPQAFARQHFFKSSRTVSVYHEKVKLYVQAEQQVSFATGSAWDRKVRVIHHLQRGFQTVMEKLLHPALHFSWFHYVEPASASGSTG